MGAGVEHRPSRWSVSESSRQARSIELRRGIELRVAERRAVNDVSGIRPDDLGRGLQDIDLHAARSAVEVDRVGRREAGRQELLIASVEHSSG